MEVKTMNPFTVATEYRDRFAVDTGVAVDDLTIGLRQHDAAPPAWWITVGLRALQGEDKPEAAAHIEVDVAGVVFSERHFDAFAEACLERVRALDALLSFDGDVPAVAPEPVSPPEVG